VGKINYFTFVLGASSIFVNKNCEILQSEATQSSKIWVTSG